MIAFFPPVPAFSFCDDGAIYHLQRVAFFLFPRAVCHQPTHPTPLARSLYIFPEMPPPSRLFTIQRLSAKHTSRLYVNLERLPVYDHFFLAAISADTLAQVCPRQLSQRGSHQSNDAGYLHLICIFTNATSLFRMLQNPNNSFIYFLVTGSKPE